jgi:hypothetical protein
MEDVLSVYHRPYDPLRPVVCIDEASKELRATPRGSLPAKPGRPKREDYEYARNGTCNLFLSIEPLAGRRQVRVTERRTSCDFAEQLRLLVDVDYPHTEMVVLVTDNLNTHSPACLYEQFAPEEARRIAERIEWHYTPEHGSWLNIAEVELSVLSRQCLNRRLDSLETVTHAVKCWNGNRNQATAQVNWQFTTADARLKLRRLYPEIKLNH